MSSPTPTGRSWIIPQGRALPAVLLPFWLAPIGLALLWLPASRGLPIAAAIALASLLTWRLLARDRGGPVEPRPSAIEEQPAGWAAGKDPGSSLTRSGLFASPGAGEVEDPDAVSSGTYSLIDMVNRLDPDGFRWIQSSLAEQHFLGWSLDQLQEKSFLDIVEDRDRPNAEKAFRLAVEQGELHGLVLRIRTARGRTKAIEVHASARYTADHKVAYLRCLLTDVTEKLRIERERRLRNQELIRVNAQLIRINHELSELKDRYSDLYENAPAMYFSVDTRGRLVECNQTFLASLQRRRDEVIGRGFEVFIDPSVLEECRQQFARLLQAGSLETESRWVKAGGEIIDVWVSGAVLRAPRGGIAVTRCVAQDLTAKHRLEAQLLETNRSLARANAELSAKNAELDEFVHVVSHDLQEPIRTLIGFSSFLLEDADPALGVSAIEHLHRLSAAAHRMRSMILGLLNLSRAGRIVDECASVDLAELVDIARSDLGELIRTRGAEVRLVGPGGTLWGDRRRLLQLLTNLISNGIKYNQNGTPLVELGVLGPADGVGPGPSQTLFVRDNGIGIEPRHHQKIFQLFRRLHTQEEYPGTGVGLAICRKIVVAHGGDIGLESVPGTGATFLISLPAGPASSPVERPEEAPPATG